MSNRDTRKYNPNALSQNDVSYPYKHIGDFRYYRYPAIADTAFFPFFMIICGVIASAVVLIMMGSNFRWENLLTEGPILVISLLFVIGGILKLRARRKREHHD